jgi:hypothetical protein
LKVLRDIFKAAGAWAIGCFSPALSATRHARNKTKRFASHPIAKALFKNMLKLPMSHLHDALREGTFVEHHAIAADERTP